MASAPSVRRVHPVLWLLFGLKGRISRKIYWLAYFFIFCVNGVLMFQFIGGPEMSAVFGGREATFYRVADMLVPFLVPVTVYSNIAVAVKRLHDVSYSGFLALAVLVPLVNIAFTIWVGVLPGTAGPNPYGETQDRPA